MATELKAVVPPAPGRFSMTNGWPTCRDSWSSTTRPVMSTALPALNGLIAEMARDGQACAWADGAAAARATAASAPHSTRMDLMRFLPSRRSAAPRGVG